MATRDQFEMINAVYAVAASDRWDDVAKSCRAIRALMELHAPLVDVSDVWQALMDGGVIDESYANRVSAPLVDPIHPMPLKYAWPVAIYSACMDGGINLWLACNPNFDFKAPILASGGERSPLVHLPDAVMTVLSWRGGKLTASRLLLDDFMPDGTPRHVSASGVMVHHTNIIYQLSLILTSGRNGKWVDGTAEPRSFRRKKRRDVPEIRFRTIRIDMGKPKRRGDGEWNDRGTCPWHLRRGHWKYFSAARPMFGRVSEYGWYWVDAAEIGDPRNGVIHQDYSLASAVP